MTEERTETARPPSRARSPFVALGLLAAVAALVAADAALTLRASPAAPAAAAAPLPAGQAVDRPLPRLLVRDAQGRATSLTAFRGRWLVLAPLATRCRESCPLTTGALLRLRAALGDRAAVAGVSVDPWHDSPARLRAFRRRTGAHLRLLTGSEAQLRRLWGFFGVHFARAGHDVEHTDGLFAIDPRGHWRLVVIGTPDVGGRLPRALAAELDADGRAALRRPGAPWTVAAVVDDLRRLTGVPAPPAAEPAAAGPGRLVDGGATAFHGRLAGLRGTPVVVNAWASWCPPCRAESPLLAAAARRHAGRVAFLGLSVTDTAGAARRFLAGHPAGYPSYADPTGAAARALGAPQGLPVTVFVDAGGRVTHVHAGAYPSAAALEDDLRSALRR